MRVTLEAVVGFVNRNNGAAVTKITTPARLLPARKTFELTTNDRRFLRSLRIGADEAKERRRQRLVVAPTAVRVSACRRKKTVLGPAGLVAALFSAALP